MIYPLDNTFEPIVLDVETFYCSKTKYSLRSMTSFEYVTDPRFKSFCWGVVFPGETKSYSLTHEEFVTFAKTAPWDKLKVVAQNCIFDATVLAQVYNIYPGMYSCTMGLSRALYSGAMKSHSLMNIASYLGLRGKLDGGQALTDMDGVSDPTPEQIKNLLLYAGQDAEEECDMYNYMAPQLPPHEHFVLDWTIKMYAQTQLKVNLEKIQAGIKEEADKRKSLLDAVPVSATTLRSGPKFAEYLESINVPVPMKESTKFDKTLNKRVKAQTYAFAKDDFAFLELGADPALAPLVEAKLAFASNQETTRLARMEGLAKRNMSIPIPMHYAGAGTTQRFSGFDGLNFQNLGRNSACRTSLEAPEGFTLVIRDSSGIEMRVMNCLAGGWGALARSYAGEDEYSLFASKVYGRPIDKHQDPTERKVGKVSVLSGGYGSGKVTYQKMLYNQAKLLKPLSFCDQVIGTYREFYHEMPAFWKWVDQQLECLIDGVEPEPFRWGAPLTWINEMNEFGDRKVGVRSVLGMEVKWWNLRKEYVDWGDGRKMQIVYDKRDKNIPGVGAIKTLWGGTGLENLSQFLAAEIMKFQTLGVACETGYYPVMHVHDENIWCVPDAYVEEFDAITAKHMSGPIPWWPKLETNSAGEISKHYVKPD